MSNQLKPHFEEYWSADLQADYSKARNDDERRRMLLRFGYDKDHKADAVRLFPEYFENSLTNVPESTEPENAENQSRKNSTTNKFVEVGEVSGAAVNIIAFIRLLISFFRRFL